jgi:pimeloyl-ACP methyl ester carboxylesterase
MSLQASLGTGASIEYLDQGQGQPLVYLHGAGGVMPRARFIPELARTFRVLAPSRPGYDGSTGTCENARDEADVTAEFIRHVADGPVHVVAESAGAAAGCWLAVLYPELVATLVLVAPAAFAAHAAVRPPEDMELVLFGSAPAWTEPLTEEDHSRRRRNATANAGRTRPADRNQALLERLSDVRAPTLILWGTADRLIPPESGQVYQHHIPHSVRVYVYGGAHSLPVAKCTAFVELTTEFIARGEAFVVNADGAQASSQASLVRM